MLSDRKLAIVSGVVALVCVAILLVKPAKVIVQQIKGESAGSVVGALTGPEIPYDHFCFGGVCDYAVSLPFTAATNTPISFQVGPQFFGTTTATTTLKSLSLQIDVGSTTKATEFFEIATSSVSGATTTNNYLMSGYITSTDGGTWNWVASTTALANGIWGVEPAFNNYVIKGKEWLIFRIASTAPYTYTGTLKAVFQATQ